MKVLKVEHVDFELIVECNNLYAAFNKAKAKQSDIFTSTSYSITSGQIYTINVATNQLEQLLTNRTHPIFFENKEYFLGISFKDKQNVSNPYIYSKMKEVQDKFYYRKELGFLAGTINFGNDLGKSDLILRYTKSGQTIEFTLNFDVFPTKLNYRSDYDKIVADIEQEYPYLVLDFLKKTYTSFKAGNSPNTDLIWWQVFGGLYKEFIHASKFILNKPHSRIITKTRYLKADRIVRWTSRLEEKFAQFNYLPNKNYSSEFKELSSNTPENRFFKYAVQKTTRRFKKIKSFITTKFAYGISDNFRTELNNIEKQMDVISNNPFFNSISEFGGIKQESLVLQKATGYSSIYKSWVMLNSGLKFLEGIQKIELKNIADLYQIWCFLEVKNIIQSILGKEKPDDVDIAEIHIDDFVFRIERGAKSRVSFRQSNGVLIDLFHDYSYNKDQNKEVRSFTVNQRPDIVLRITKNDLKENYILTYLYDAKYRLISDDRVDAPDLPPEDAINQMHRYRDAIYYVNKSRNKPEKEVIGAYVLFPGSGDIEQVKSSPYFKSIEDVNIGAFPLRPNDNYNRTLLEDHLRIILAEDTETVLNAVSPQKLSSYESPNPEVIIGIVPNEEHAKCFKDGDSPFYFTGKDKPNYFGYKNLRYFAPYIAKQGVSEYYEILRYEIIQRNKLFKPGEKLFTREDSSERLVLRLGKRFSISTNNESYKLSDGIIRHYRYSTLSFIRNPKNHKIEVLKISI